MIMVTCNNVISFMQYSYNVFILERFARASSKISMQSFLFVRNTNARGALLKALLKFIAVHTTYKIP